MVKYDYSNMKPSEAYEIAKMYRSPGSSFADFWRLEKIVYDGKDADTALSWAKWIGTQEDRMLDVVLTYGSLQHFIDWVGFEPHNKDRILLIKRKVIQLNSVKLFINRMRCYYDALYSDDDFYEGLSDECKLGVMI